MIRKKMMDSIVIIDPDKEMIQTLTKELDWERLGCRVAAAVGTAEEGMERIRAIRPRLVITETGLPGLSGLEMIQRLKEEGCDGDFVILTERRIFGEARQAVQLGVKGFLTKPLDRQEAGQTFCRILYREKPFERGTYGKDACAWDDSRMESLQGTSRVIRQAVSYIDAHLYRELSLTAVCEAMGVSPSYFSRLFKQETGVGFLKYVRMKKLEEARRLLQNPGHKASRVAEMLGYHNYSYFYQIYKEQFGFSPGERR